MISSHGRSKMEEKQEKLRPLDEIQKDFNQNLLLAGEKEYRLRVLQSELHQIYNKINELNLEAHKQKEVNDETTTT